MPYKDSVKQKLAQRKWFEDHREIYRLKKRADVNKKRDYVANLKNNPCLDCGIKYPPCAMDFDHRDGVTKERNVASSVTHGGWEKLKVEIAKCDLVCANCHRVRTQMKLHL